MLLICSQVSPLRCCCSLSCKNGFEWLKTFRFGTGISLINETFHGKFQDIELKQVVVYLILKKHSNLVSLGFIVVVLSLLFIILFGLSFLFPRQSFFLFDKEF